MAPSDRQQQQFEVYRNRPQARTQDDDSKFWLLLVLIGMVALGIGGAIYASRTAEDKPAEPTENGTEAVVLGEPAPQSVFDRLDWIEGEEGPESALSLAEEKYLVEYPNAPNLLQRIEELKAATTVGEDAIVTELREDARRQVGAGQTEEALATIDQILERTDGEDAEAQFLKAKALMQTGDTFGAAGALEEAEILGYNAAEIQAVRGRLEGE